MNKIRLLFASSPKIALVALIASMGLLSLFYLTSRQAFFDDVFIYLHIAKNGADFGTWQFFPTVDRPALLASSPLKITVLTIAAWLSNIVGFETRSLFNAKIILIIYSYLAWLIWLPFWRRNGAVFLWVGVVYFLAATALDAVVDFEGGLLFLWGVTMMVSLSENADDNRASAWLIPIGFMIRPDVVLPVAVALAIKMGKEKVVLLVKPVLLATTFLFVTWVFLSWAFDVWFLPVTYWTKSAAPTLFEQRYMLEVFFERIGQVIGGRLVRSSPVMAITVGLAISFGFLLSIISSKRDRVTAVAVLGVSLLLLSRAPSNFWWYYQNIFLLMFGIACGVSLRMSCRVDILRNNANKGAAVFAISAFFLMLAGKAGSDGPLAFSFHSPSRAQGYQYLAERLVGQGIYDLEGVGRVIIKNPEMGITNYFGGEKSWIWDSAGLAQPLDDERVRKSLLKHLYPEKIHRPAIDDAKFLAEKQNLQFRVVEVWAMDDRDFEAARKKCHYVLEEAALCINKYIN